MSVLDELDYTVKPANAAQRITQKIAASAPGAWLSQRTLYPFDKLLYKRTKGRVTIAELMAGSDGLVEFADPPMGLFERRAGLFAARHQRLLQRVVVSTQAVELGLQLGDLLPERIAGLACRIGLGLQRIALLLHGVAFLLRRGLRVVKCLARRIALRDQSVEALLQVVLDLLRGCLCLAQRLLNKVTFAAQRIEPRLPLLFAVAGRRVALHDLGLQALDLVATDDAAGGDARGAALVGSRSRDQLIIQAEGIGRYGKRGAQDGCCHRGAKRIFHTELAAPSCLPARPCFVECRREQRWQTA